MLAGVVVFGLVGCNNSPAPTPGSTAVGGSSTTVADSTSPKSNEAPRAGSSATNPPSESKPSSPITPDLKKGGQGTKVADDKVAVPTASEGWNPSTTTAEDLAKESESKMAALKNVTAHVTLYYKGEKGMGSNVCLVSVVNQDKYRVEYPVLSGFRPVKYALVKNGSQTAVMKAGGPGQNDPATGLPKKFDGALSSWIDTFPSLMFTSLWGGHPIGDLVTTVRKLGSAATLKVEERQFEYKGHVFHQKRIVIKSQGGEGPTTDITLVVDTEHTLPVTVDAVRNLSLPKETAIHWTSGWDLHSDQTFDPKLFQIGEKK